jgi:hypothetical protein
MVGDKEGGYKKSENRESLIDFVLVFYDIIYTNKK